MQDLNELKLAFIKSYYNILSCSINHLSLNNFLVRREREREGGERERERGGNGEKRERDSEKYKCLVILRLWLT